MDIYDKIENLHGESKEMLGESQRLLNEVKSLLESNHESESRPKNISRSSRILDILMGFFCGIAVSLCVGYALFCKLL